MHGTTVSLTRTANMGKEKCGCGLDASLSVSAARDRQKGVFVFSGIADKI